MAAAAAYPRVGRSGRLRDALGSAADGACAGALDDRQEDFLEAGLLHGPRTDARGLGPARHRSEYFRQCGQATGRGGAPGMGRDEPGGQVEDSLAFELALQTAPGRVADTKARAPPRASGVLP